MKRFEMYLGWKCNHKCMFCNELQNIQNFWDKEFSEKEVLAKLLTYKKQGYNHVTYLGGEPFIQKNFPYAIRAAKALGYTLLVTTNGTTLQFDRVAKDTVPFIDELIISLPSLTPENQMYVNHTKTPLNYEKIFTNIYKYFKGSFVKVNTVIGKHNYLELESILYFLSKFQVQEVSFTYPSMGSWVGVNGNNVLMRYTELRPYLEKCYEVSQNLGIDLRICDIPFCCLGEAYMAHEDLYYTNRIKIDVDQKDKVSFQEKELNRKSFSPRKRKQISVCKNCSMNSSCWGPEVLYVESFFDDREIIPCALTLSEDTKKFIPENCLI